MSQGFYELLGVEPDASDDTIRQAYQVRLARLVRRLRTARQNGADVTILEAQERSLREAREVLSDTARRRRYDTFREAIDHGMPESAEALWETVRGALVAPEVSLALAAVKALTDLPLGQPVPAPPEPVRVHRVEPEPTPVAVVAAHDDRAPDRPTLVPRTDPGIEISLSDDELRWLEDPPTPAPLVGPPMLQEPPSEPVWVDDTWSDTVDTSIPPTDPDDYEDDYDDFDDDYADDFDDPDLRPTDARGASRGDNRGIPGLGFLSRLSLPKAPSWAGGNSREERSGGPSLVSVPADPIARAERQLGRTGPFLRSVRESRGLSLDDLSKGTRISSRYLEAIEADAFDRLPSAIFVQGYVKQVVEQLELDGNGVVEAFMAAYRAQRG
jgi:hypothetical protein